MNFIFLTVFIALFASPVHGSLCDKCNRPETSNETEVEKYCHEYNLNMTSRCCVNSTAHNFTDADIVGIDLRNCSLENVTGIFKNMTSVVIILLQDNNLTAVTEKNFYNLTHLDYLSLPGNIQSCPGGSLAWNVSSHSADNLTLICETQMDTCSNEDNNATCPSPQSYCRAAGPGLVDCLCSPDYHGYKCLRKGTFPLYPFVGGICGSTFVTAIFLWVTQRRFVKKHSN
ncbi:all-trans retinoic acid-induced differentiation factor-like [Babylonia areolata]|uniref:all-trans retinoic acid-induced differentiation factor-like n=1 Tax=Babylonia areolata TaxID=304850 RepID=UPI003FD2BC9E